MRSLYSHQSISSEASPDLLKLTCCLILGIRPKCIRLTTDSDRRLPSHSLNTHTSNRCFCMIRCSSKLLSSKWDLCFVKITLPLQGLKRNLLFLVSGRRLCGDLSQRLQNTIYRLEFLLQTEICGLQFIADYD